LRWGSAYECFTSLRFESFPFGITCTGSPSFDGSGNPQPYFLCRDANGNPPAGSFMVDFVCVQ
jgi:hypothetical protein